ncbi:MAG TPA: hypothetical protein VHC98_01600 [Candidatus Saccharimonadales bacterium]|nr:hypothetical protein [Candidatus Saccharimonadales bacterium]
MTAARIDLAVYLLAVLATVKLAGWYVGRRWHGHRFTFGRYGLLLAGPLLAVVYASWRAGFAVPVVFVASAVVGPVLEFLTGRAYAHVVGTRLWSYHRFDFSGNTSWLAAPIWGLAGVLALLIARAV